MTSEVRRAVFRHLAGGGADRLGRPYLVATTEMRSAVPRLKAERPSGLSLATAGFISTPPAKAAARTTGSGVSADGGPVAEHSVGDVKA
jgi:hypothetical protein